MAKGEKPNPVSNANDQMEEVKAKNSLATASPHTLNYLRQQQNLISASNQKVSQTSGSSFEMDLFPAASSRKSLDLLKVQHVGDVITPSYGITLRSPGTVNGRISRTMYELSEDMKANLLCFTEQCYGGRERSHEAARTIQRAYRQYRLQKNFKNLRKVALRHSNSSTSNAVIRETLTPKPVTLLNSNAKPLPTVGSIEDLHGSEAYLKWQKSNEDADDSSISSSSKSSNPVISSTEPKDLDSDLKSSQRDSGLSDNSPNDSFKSSRSPSSPNCSFNSHSTGDSFSPSQQNFIYPRNQQQQQSPSRRPNLASPSKHSTCFQCQNSSYSVSNAPLVRRISSCNDNLKYVLVPTQPVCQPGQQLYFTQKAGHQVLLCNDKNSSVYVLAPGTQLVTGTSNKSEFIQPTHTDLANKALQESLNKQRKRLYRIGLNFFNKNPLKGIDYLVKNGFLESSPQMIAKFLLTRRGLSRTAIGDYLGTINEFCTETTKHFMRSIDMNDLEVDEALRAVMANFRNPGESQKIEHLMNVFQEAYVEQNESRVQALFKNPEKIFLLAYAIMILQTDLHVAKTKPGTKMKRQDFIRNLRPVNPEEEALNPEMLGAIYDRIAKKEITTQEDHTDFVRKIEQSLTGSLKPYPLTIPQRRLVCYCRLYEVPDKNKKERLGAHERDVFLFNDMLLITKANPNRQKRNTGTLTNSNKADGIHSAGVSYQVKASINLLGIKVALWDNANYSYGVEICKGQSYAAASGTDTKAKSFSSDVLFALNTKTSADRKSFFADLVECIQEVNEQDRIRIEGELAKSAQPQQSPSKGSSKSLEQKVLISSQQHGQQNLQFVRHLSTGMIPSFPANGNASMRMNTSSNCTPVVSCSHCNGANYVAASADGQAILLHQPISPRSNVLFDQCAQIPGQYAPAPILLASGPGNIAVPAKMLYSQGPVNGKPPIMYLMNNNNGTPILQQTIKASQKPP